MRCERFISVREFVKMTSAIRTLLFDFRLTSLPADVDIAAEIVKILESEAFSKSDKFSKLSPVPIPQKQDDIKTFIFESDSSDVFVTIRVYEKSDDHVLVTLLVELTT